MHWDVCISMYFILLIKQMHCTCICIFIDGLNGVDLQLKLNLFLVLNAIEGGSGTRRKQTVHHWFNDSIHK